MNTLIKKTALIAFAATNIIAISMTSASAANGDYEFTYRPSELTSTSGVNRVVERLTKKAARSCNSNSTPTLHSINFAKKCEAALIADVVSKIDNKRLANAFSDTIQLAQK